MPLKYVMLKLDGGELLPLLPPNLYTAQAVPATVVSPRHVHLEDGKIVASGASKTQ